jgi:hypothetical protein
MATVTLPMINILLYPRNRQRRFYGYIIDDLKVQMYKSINIIFGHNHIVFNDISELIINYNKKLYILIFIFIVDHQFHLRRSNPLCHYHIII